MSFYSAKESFFLDGLASSIRPIVEVVPLTNIDVFQYLDAHPEVLQNYFEERQGLLKSFTKPGAGDQCVLCGYNAPSTKSHVSGQQKLSFSRLVLIAETETADQENKAGEDKFSEHGLDPALWVAPDFNTIWTPTFDLFPDSLSSPPLSPWGAPTPPSVAAATTSETLAAITSESNPRAFTLSSPASPKFLPSIGGKSLPTGGKTVHTAGKTLPATSSSSSSQPQVTTLKTPKKNSRKWSPEEEASCIKHMSAVVREGIVMGEARFREAGRRMKEVDGFERTKSTAIKNFWNRVGRARSGIDERKNRNAPLATSLQGKSARLSLPKLSQNQQKPQTAPKRRPLKQDSDSDSDDEQDLVSPDSTTTQPMNFRKRPRKSIPDTDSESEWEPQQDKQRPERDNWEPDEDILNAIAKGVRPRKQARIGY